jgi:TolB-like protein
MNVRLILNGICLCVIAATLAAAPAAPAVNHTFHPGTAPKAEFKVAGKSYKIDPKSSSARKIREIPPEHFDPITRRDRVDQFYRDKLKDRFKDRNRFEKWHCGPFRPEFIFWVDSWRAQWRARWAWHHRMYLDELLWNQWMTDSAFAAEIAALQRANTAVDPDYMPADYAKIPAVSIYADEYINAVYNPTPFLAVLKLKSLKPDAKSDWIASATSDSLLSNLSSIPGLFIADPQDVSGALRDQKLSDSDIAEPSRAAQVGKAVDVERVVTGSYVADGDKVLFNLRIVNAKTGAVENGVSKTVARDKLLDEMPGLASSLAVMLGYAPLPASDGTPTASASPTPSSNITATIQQRLASAPLARRTLKASDQLGAEITFTSDEGPYEIQDKIGVADDIKKCTLHFGPGADVRGGAVPSKKTFVIDIGGTADNPVILRHIDFAQDLGGNFKARYAIFDNCTFHKTGAWYANAGFTSKWEFNNCIIRGGKPFPKITHVDYGIKFNNCTFSNVTLSEIIVGQPKDKPLDYMNTLRKNWRIIDHCSFDGCTVPPTVFWCAMASNYSKCEFATGPAFESDTATDVVAFVTNTIGDAPDKISEATPPKRAALHITYAPQPFNIPSLLATSVNAMKPQ